MRYQDILNWMYRQESVRQNTIKIVESEDGRLRFRPIIGDASTTSDTLRGATEFVRQLGVTGVQEYTSGVPFGTQAVQEEVMARLAKRGNYSIQVESYNFQEPAQADKMIRSTIRNGEAFGVVSYDGPKAVVQRIFQDGKELNEQQVMDVFRDTLGMFMDPTVDPSKYNKRAKAFTTPKRAEAVFKDPIRLSITDARADLKGLTETQRSRALDGALEVSSFHLEKQKEFLENQIAKIDSKMGTVTDRATLLQLEAVKNKNQGALKEVMGALTGTNKTFNVRILGFDIIAGEGMADDALRDVVRKIQDGGSVKGNATVARNLDARNRAAGWIPGLKASEQSAEFLSKAIDFQTDYDNIKADRFGTTVHDAVNGVARSKVDDFGFVTLENQKIGDLYTDFQGMTAHTELFPRDHMEQMIRTTQEEFLGMARQLDEPGDLPFMLRDMLERQAGVAEGMQRWQIESLDPVLQREAADVLARLDEGASISKNPFLKKRMLALIEAGATHKGMLRMRIPDSMRAYVGTTASDRVFEGQLAKNSIALDPETNRLIMTPEDFDRYYANFGGADLDDALNNVIRVDSDGNLRAVLTRAPTARGEIAFMDVHNQEEMFKHLLVGRMSREDKFQELSRAKTDSEMLSSMLKHNDDFQMYLQHRGNDELRAAAEAGDYDALRQITSRLKDEAGKYGPLGDVHEFIGEMGRKSSQRKSAAALARTEVTDDPRFLRYQRLLEKARSATGPAARKQAELELNAFLTRRVGIGSISRELEEGIPSRGARVDLGTRSGIQYYRYEGEGGGLVYQESAQATAESVTRSRFKGTNAEFRIAQAKEMSNEIVNQSMLGRFSNARMLVDNFMANNERALVDAGITPDMSRITADNFFNMLDNGKILATMEQEQAIDTIKGMVQGMPPAEINSIIKNMQRNVVLNAMRSHHELGVEAGAKIDIGMIKESVDLGPDEFDAGRMSMKELRGISEEIKREYTELKDISIDDITTEGPVHAARAAAAEYKAMIQEISSAATFDDDVLNMKITNRNLAAVDARMIKEAYFDSIKNFNLINDLDDIHGLADVLDEGQMAGMKGRVLENDVMRAVAGTFEEVKIGDRYERVAGQRTFEAMATLMQEDDRYLRAIPNVGLIENFVDFAKGELDAPLTLAEVNAKRGTALLPGEEVNRIMREALGDEHFNRLNNINTALMGLADDERTVSQGVFELLGDMDEGATRVFIPREAPRISSFLDPQTIVRSGPETFSIGDLVADAALPKGSGKVNYHKRRIAKRKLRAAADNYFDVTAQFAADANLDEETAQIFGSNLPPGTRKAATARAAAEASEEVTINARKTGFLGLAEELIQRPAGRAGLAGAGVAIAAALLHTSKRDNDRTIEEMQGPANLPGGNPYTRARGLPNFDNLPPPSTLIPERGMTYEVRGNGGSRDSFIDSVNSLTGANVSTTTYDRGFQPRIEEWL